MDVKLMIQGTPNPNALKFVLNKPVKTEGKITYKNAGECADNPLAQELFKIEHVNEVFFFDNYITITQDSQGDWDEIEEKVQATIMALIGSHDPDFRSDSQKQTKPRSSNPDLVKIDEILDRTVRPALQMDGGDLQLITLENNVLTVNYQGACGSCPSSTAGTLKAIEGLLRDEFNPDIVVEIG